jgi:hypothetical protein
MMILHNILHVSVCVLTLNIFPIVWLLIHYVFLKYFMSLVQLQLVNIFSCLNSAFHEQE